MFESPLFRFLVVVAAVALVATAARAVTIDYVPIGNPGNPDDTRYETPGYGGVDYVYAMGKYEVTAGQYAEFLNAVADTDTYGLYNTSMCSSGNACKIQRSGSSGSYSYLVDADGDGNEDADWVNRPVNYVSWGDAARFANWLHNGQPTGAQDLTTTEDGSYYLNGATTDAQLLAVTREADATWWLPSEDEWYKAAYYDADKPGGVGYWDYPTKSDDPDVPSNDLIDPDPGNNANFQPSFGDYTIGEPYYRTEVGEFENSESPCGTFDQGGNVWEWTEAIFGNRVLRGGSHLSVAGRLHASYFGQASPTYADARFGFRAASVPEPSTGVLAIVGMLCGLWWSRRRGR